MLFIVDETSHISFSSSFFIVSLLSSNDRTTFSFLKAHEYVVSIYYQKSKKNDILN